MCSFQRREVRIWKAIDGTLSGSSKGFVSKVYLETMDNMYDAQGLYKQVLNYSRNL
jgi:hypothetical protein